MKIHNPWIDPRIEQVCPEEARKYLLRCGWKLIGPANNLALTLYEGPGGGENVPAVLLPSQAADGAMLQRMIDLIAAVAAFEGRYAGDVLTDMLPQQ
jgi:hypothetical protein